MHCKDIPTHPLLYCIAFHLQFLCSTPSCKVTSSPSPTNPDVGVLMVRYQVATVGGVWLPEMHDLYDHSGSGDDYAGNGARIDRFRACYGRAI